MLDGAGKVFGCGVDAVSKREVQLRVVKTELVQALPYRLTLLLAVPKGKLIDSIIQKATELGVARIARQQALVNGAGAVQIARFVQRQRALQGGGTLGRRCSAGVIGLDRERAAQAIEQAHAPGSGSRGESTRSNW